MSKKDQFKGIKDLPIGNYSKSFLGSNQSIKCLLREEGCFYFKFASTLLEHLDIEHPVFKYIVDVSQEFRKVYGARSADELLFYIHSWSRDASQLCDMGIPIDCVLKQMEDVLNETIQYVDTIKWKMSEFTSGSQSHEMRNQGLKSSEACCNTEAEQFVSNETEIPVENDVVITEKQKFQPKKYDTAYDHRAVCEVEELSKSVKKTENIAGSGQSAIDNNLGDDANEAEDVSWFFDDVDVTLERSGLSSDMESRGNMTELSGDKPLPVWECHREITEQVEDKPLSAFEICADVAEWSELNQGDDQTDVQSTGLSYTKSKAAKDENVKVGKPLNCKDNKDNDIEVIRLEMKNSVTEQIKLEDENVSWFFDSDETSNECIDLYLSQNDVKDTDVTELVDDDSEEIIEDLRKLQADISKDIERITKPKRPDKNSELGRHVGDDCDKNVDGNGTLVQKEHDEFDDCFEKCLDGFDDNAGSDIEDEFHCVELMFKEPLSKKVSSVIENKKMEKNTEHDNGKTLCKPNVGNISIKDVPTQAHINDLDLQQCRHDYNKIKGRLSGLRMVDNCSKKILTKDPSISSVPVTTNSLPHMTEDLELCKNGTSQGEHNKRKDKCLTDTVGGQMCDSSTERFKCDTGSQIKGIDTSLQTLRKSEGEQHSGDIKCLHTDDSNPFETSIDECPKSSIVSNGQDVCSNQIKDLNAILEKIKAQKATVENNLKNGQNLKESSNKSSDGNVIEIEAITEDKSVIKTSVKTQTETKDADQLCSEKFDNPSFSTKGTTQGTNTCHETPSRTSCYSKSSNLELTGNVTFNHNDHLSDCIDSSNSKGVSEDFYDLNRYCGTSNSYTLYRRMQILTRSRHMQSDENPVSIEVHNETECNKIPVDVASSSKVNNFENYPKDASEVHKPLNTTQILTKSRHMQSDARIDDKSLNTSQIVTQSRNMQSDARIEDKSLNTSQIVTRSRHMQSDGRIDDKRVKTEPEIKVHNKADCDKIPGNVRVSAEDGYNDANSKNEQVKLSDMDEADKLSDMDEADKLSDMDELDKLSDQKTYRACIQQLVNGINYRGDQTINKAVSEVIAKQSNRGSLRLDSNIVVSNSMVGAYSPPSVVNGVVILTSSSNMLALHKLQGHSCRALLVNGDIDMSFKHKGYKPTKSSSITSLSMFMKEIPESEQWLREIIDVLQTLCVNVLFVKGKVSADMCCVCQSLDIVVMETVPYKQLLQLSEAAQIDMLTYVTLATQINVVELVSIQPLRSDWCDVDSTGNSDQEVVVVLPRNNPQTVIISECSSIQADLKDQELWDCLKKLTVLLESGDLLPGMGQIEATCVTFIERCICNMVMDITLDCNANLLYREHVLKMMASTFQEFTHLLQTDTIEDTVCTDCYKVKLETWKVAMETVCVIMKLDSLIVTGLTDNLNERTL